MTDDTEQLPQPPTILSLQQQCTDVQADLFLQIPPGKELSQQTRFWVERTLARVASVVQGEMQ